MPRSETAAHALTFPYRRTVGPLMSRFFSELQDQRILGVRTAAGNVLVPPTEYDPFTAEPLDQLVEVGPNGAVESWGWVHSPRPSDPLTTPFAWALIRLDGASVSMIHVVKAPDESAIHQGLRVKPCFSNTPAGGIRDIDCFVPEVDSE